MVASENGTLHMPQTAPLTSQPAPSSSKEKKPKGLFKAPTYPSSVLRPRARVTAPTPSTAAESSSLSLPVDPDAPSTRTNAPDSRTSKVITAKRAKELEREAKEKEYADGQHANMIDGVWHCSNCGCPEDIAVGRRKGPLGDKSQCGTCGKYWHRHRRPMVVEYNSSAEFHLNKIKDAELARTVARKKGGAAALRAQNASSTAAGDDTETPSSPQNENGVEPLPQPSRPPTVPASEDDRAASPGSSTSSDSESPLAQKVSKANGTNHAASAPPAPTPSGPVPIQPSQPVSQSVPPSTTASAPPATAAHHDPPNPPKWLWNATQAMRTKYPDDLFVLKRINGSEWRIKCSDCPGKLYTPGPGETLSNYEVHLKNRQHRQKVNDRKNGVVSQPH
jgi:SWI/SNF-related matrix-associated actin-dependent regulator of chromatin subfamily B protein 1